MKKLGIIFCCMLVILSAGCSAQGDKDIDIRALADELHENISEADAMIELEAGILENFYLFEEDTVADYKIYVSGNTGIAADIAVIKAASQESVASVREAVERRISDLNFNFEGYIPAQIDKISNCILVEKGSYIILCITEDYATAQTIIDSYTK